MLNFWGFINLSKAMPNHAKKHHNKSQTPTKTQSYQMPSLPGQPETIRHTEIWSTLVSIKSYTSQSNAKYHQYLILQRQVTEKDFSNMRFLYQVVHDVCSLFLKHKQQQFKWSHRDGWRLVKNGCSAKCFKPPSESVLLLEFHMWRLPSTKGSEKNAYSPLLCKMVPKLLKKRPLARVNTKSCQIQ